MTQAGATKFIGCIGKDKEGKQLKELLQKQGRLGKCWKLSSQLKRSADSVLLKLARYCQQTGKLFACNLSAEFLMHQFKSEYKEMLCMANITCGNKEEATKYAEINGFDVSGSTGDIASQILDCMLEGLDDGPSKMKMVVITQGSDPVIVASRTFMFIPVDAMLDHEELLSRKPRNTTPILQLQKSYDVRALERFDCSKNPFAFEVDATITPGTVLGLVGRFAPGKALAARVWLELD
ncbi:hypothetical protein Emag_003013 [Eimeria magna]